MTLAAAALPMACSTFEAEETAPVAPDASDGGGNVVESGSLDGVVAASTILSDDFDVPIPLCGGSWQPLNATANIAVGEGLDGGGACKICQNGSNNFYLQRTSLTAVPGTTYYAEIWARDAVTGAAVNLKGGIEMTETPDGSLYVTQVTPQLGKAWQQVQINHTAKTDQLKVVLSLFADGLNDCVFVDRFSVTKL
jgi:hypothetical protein